MSALSRFWVAEEERTVQATHSVNPRKNSPLELRSQSARKTRDFAYLPSSRKGVFMRQYGA